MADVADWLLRPSWPVSSLTRKIQQSAVRSRCKFSQSKQVKTTFSIERPFERDKLRVQRSAPTLTHSSLSRLAVPPYQKTSKRKCCTTYATTRDKAREARPAYPKKQTGVTLKSTGPCEALGNERTEDEKHLTESVHRSICDEPKVEEQLVECKVETVAWRKRHISASIEVAATLEQVWGVLTDYERLADFIPNLAKSERIPCPNPGRVWLLQLGVQSSMYWQIEARVVLDLEERFASDGGPELHFSMVEGDFKVFAGKWSLRASEKPGYVTLRYEVDVLPRAILPTAFVEKIIQADLPRNLRAIANRAQAMTSSPEPRAPAVTSSSGGGDGVGSPIALPSVVGMMTSSKPGAQAVTSSSSGESGGASPSSLVAVANGAGAGLDMEVSWWSGPGQQPNPGLIEGGGAVEERGSELRRGEGTDCVNGFHTEAGGHDNGTPEAESLVNETSRSGIDGNGRVQDHTKKRSLKAGSASELPARDGETTSIPKLSLETDLRTGVAYGDSEPDSTFGVHSSNRRPKSEKHTQAEVQGTVTEPPFELVDAPYFPAECPVDRPGHRAGLRQKVDEVHLRRLDDLLEKGGVHRRVIAAITIAATAEAVWDVLTDYESLKDFIPNLAKSEVQSRHQEEHRVRLHQVGVKCLCYMVLHAQATMDIIERPYKEICFTQVDGDFDSFEGRWLLEPLGPGHTMLKYSVETRVRKNSLLPEALVEEVIFEDLPANLYAIRKRVEANKSIYSDPSFLCQEKDPPETGAPQQGGRSWGKSTRVRTDEVSEIPSKKKTLRKPSVNSPGTYLEAEKVLNQSDLYLNAENGATQGNDARKRMRNKPRTVDTRGESAPKNNSPPSKSVNKREVESGLRTISTAGGVRPVRSSVYTDFAVLESALRAFVSEHGVPGVMPNRSQLRASERVDLEKGMRLHGGPARVAARLGLTVQHQQKPAGYWCDLENVEREIKAFLVDTGLVPDVMPTRRIFERAGRFDIACALKKWGGPKSLAAKLKFKDSKHGKVT